MNFYNRVLANLEKDVLSLVSPDGYFSAGDLRDSVSRYESMLTPLNIEGKRVALLIPSLKEFLPLFLAANKLKGTVSPLSWQFRQDDLLNVLDFLDPHIVLTVDEHNGFAFSETVTNWAKSKDSETTVVTSKNGVDWELNTFKGSSKKLQSDLGGFITFTSGSTGTPKGIVFKDSVFDYGSKKVLEAMNIKPADNVFVYASPSTLYGVVAMNSMLKFGATLVVSNDFDLVKIIDTMEKSNCNKFTTTPSIFKALYNFASRLKPEVLKKLELVCVIGEKIPANFKSNFPLMKKCTFISHYGSSESGSLANVCLNENSEELEFTIANEIEYKTVDNELLVKTRGLFTEYYNNPNITSEAFKDGWFKMGDLVEFTGYKTFKLVGRKKDVIKKGGQQVVSSEVEQILSSIKGIMSVAVVGLPHDIYGEQVVAFVIADGLNSKDIRSYCSGRVASFKIPDQIVFVEEFPLTQGKVDKIKLKSLLERGNN
ncbi:class I adenylate-forming enzyme family protein [Aquibacillus sediminis]|uniref:class I adenylate-forming enzyme family protein n=1 Tax=Aquibacillus sediminis TaxID=2574734 RepID=UPI0011089EB7|nr:class I adenylate-forming enzyme family protein [Aquibacillus sediminis]